MRDDIHAVIGTIALGILVFVVFMMLVDMFAPSIKIGCDQHWTIVDKYIITHTNDDEYHHIVARSNSDQSIIETNNTELYYSYQINDPANVCTYQSKFTKVEHQYIEAMP